MHTCSSERGQGGCTSERGPESVRGGGGRPAFDQRRRGVGTDDQYSPLSHSANVYTATERPTWLACERASVEGEGPEVKSNSKSGTRG